MKAINFSMILLTMYCLSGCSNTMSEEGATALKEELLIAVEKFNKAFAEGNVQLLESMITENYQHTNGNAVAIRKDAWVNYLHKRKQEITSGILIVNGYEMDQVEIELYNTTAIVTARFKVSSTKQGRASENEYRVTNLWVNEDGSWKRAGFHDGKIK